MGRARRPERPWRPWGRGGERVVGVVVQGSFSAVSKPNFARKYAFESSRRDLHNALLCTALKLQFFKKLLEFSILPKFS